jgi:hypothetical protein
MGEKQSSYVQELQGRDDKLDRQLIAQGISAGVSWPS